ncbi:MAG: hypothetical protein ACKVE4_12330 [Dissulfuribacterales bacterium]
MDEHYLGILLEEMNGNIKLVLEGHEGLRHDMRRLEDHLGRKIDENTSRIKINTEAIKDLGDKLSARIDAVATDLAAHRRDTELHRSYQVSESSPSKP